VAFGFFAPPPPAPPPLALQDDEIDSTGFLTASAASGALAGKIEALDEI
jgi:hypothetical protein